MSMSMNMNSTEAIKLLERAGYVGRNGNGSHYVMSKGDKSISIPRGQRGLTTGMIVKIRKRLQAEEERQPQKNTEDTKESVQPIYKANQFEENLIEEPKAPLIYDREKIYQLVKECTASNFTIQETVLMLNAEGFCTKSGKPFDYDAVNSVRQTLRNKEKSISDSEITDNQPTTPPQSEEIETLNMELEVAEPPQKQVPVMDLLGLVLSSPTDDYTKLSLIKKIHAGEITSDVMVSHSEGETDDGIVITIHEHHLRTGKRYESELSKAQVSYILKNLSIFEKFINA